MSTHSKKRTHSLATLAKLRRCEEKRTLARLNHSRKTVEEKRRRLSELRQKRRRASVRVKRPVLQGLGTGNLIRQRLLLDVLRRCEARCTDELEQSRQTWTSELALYEDARARRRAAESLRDRIHGEAEALEAAEEEKLEPPGKARVEE